MENKTSGKVGDVFMTGEKMLQQLAVVMQREDRRHPVRIRVVGSSGSRMAALSAYWNA